MVRSLIDIILMVCLSAKLPSAHNLFDFLQIPKNLAQNTQTQLCQVHAWCSRHSYTYETALFSKWIGDNQKVKSYLNQSNQPLAHAYDDKTDYTY